MYTYRHLTPTLILHLDDVEFCQLVVELGLVNDLGVRTGFRLHWCIYETIRLNTAESDKVYFFLFLVTHLLLGIVIVIKRMWYVMIVMVWSG